MYIAWPLLPEPCPPHDRQFHKPVIERSVDRTELYIADELFFCGSGYEIVPIVDVDGLRIGDGKPGEMTRHLLNDYREVVTGISTAHSEWRTPVYE